VLTVRPAGEEDLPALYGVRDAVFVQEQQVPPEIERDAEDAGADHVVALLDGRVVGTGRLMCRPDGVGVVGRMAVLPEARGRGVGAALLRALEERARERGLRAGELHAQTHARGFYQRDGYVAYGPTYSEAGIDHVNMGKSLGQEVLHD
jgi:predicted GNAT family N-acyltransferase